MKAFFLSFFLFAHIIFQLSHGIYHLLPCIVICKNVFPFSTFLGYFQALEVCDNFIQLGVEIALNLQINFGKFDMILSSKN